MHLSKCLVPGRAFALITFLAALALPARADVVSDWNAKAEAIAIEKQLLPPPNAHGMAILHVAIFEAVNAVDRRFAPYRSKLNADQNASKEAAAASAAHRVLVTLYPDQKASLDSTLKASLAAIVDENSKTNGIELGAKAAAEVFGQRLDDGANAPESYRPYTVPGAYVPTVIPVSSTYGSVKPWVMERGAQFRPAAPPPLDSETWTRDVNEIREMGVLQSTKRTGLQTDIARFWFVTGPQAWNSVIRQLVAAKKLDLVDSARMFALVAMAADDAFIAVFDAKYAYNFWRPITAIRNADLTRNPATPREPSWRPLGDTPMHPEYPCAHCITSSAVGAVLIKEFGNEIPEVSMTSPTAPGVTRKWTRIHDYIDEVSAARIYAGFHYRFSVRVGEEMGRQIGDLTAATQLQRVDVAAGFPR